MQKVRFEVRGFLDSITVYRKVLKTKDKHPEVNDWNKDFKKSNLLTQMSYPVAESIGARDWNSEDWDDAFSMTEDAVRRFHTGDYTPGFANETFLDDTWIRWHGTIWLDYGSPERREVALEKIAAAATGHFGWFRAFRPMYDDGKERLNHVGILVPDYALLLNEVQQNLYVERMAAPEQRLVLPRAA